MAGHDDDKNNKNDGMDTSDSADVDPTDDDQTSADVSQTVTEEYDSLDSKLDELNTALDFLEQKNDDIHDRLKELLQSNIDIRKELKNENSEITAVNKEK